MRLGEIITFYNGKAFSQEELLNNGKYKVLRVGNLFTNDKYYYSNLELDADKYIENGDLIYSWSATFGPRIYYGNKCIYHYHIWKCEFDNDRYSKYFLNYLLQNDVERIKTQRTGGTLVHVTKSAIEKRKIYLPNHKEQIKIGSFLQLLDKKIEKQQQLIELLKKYKKGLVREIMNQNINTHNETMKNKWKSYRLDEVVIFLDGKRKPLESVERANMKGQYPYYGASGIIDYINDYLFDEELLLLGEDGANIITRSTPLCFIAKGKYWVNNHAHVMRPNKNFDIYFLCEALENIDYTRYNTGTAQPKLNQEKCRSIMIKCPNYEEQEKIGSLLSIFNKLIILNEEKLDKLLVLKRGLLQQLFI